MQRHTWTILAAVLALVLIGAIEMSLSAAEKEKSDTGSGLFNGKNLDGWREAKGEKHALDGMTEAFKGRFKVADGALVYDPQVKGDSYIETTREFAKDVTIKIEFTPGPKCNNDVFLRGTKFDIVPGNKECKDVKEGELSTLQIVVTGDKIEHKINGTVVRTSKANAAASPLMLRAEFGELRIKSISATE